MTNEQVFKESNPFDNNMLSSSKPDNKRKIREKFLSESFSNEWVFKIASVVENEKINLFQVLTSFDLDGDGFVDLNELINALKQIGIFLSENEIDGMQKYTMLSNNGSDKIEIKQFASNFMRKKIGEEGKVNVDANMKGVEGGY
jgi:Ca2+-binding EF-hand superfamily protein